MAEEVFAAGPVKASNVLLDVAGFVASCSSESGPLSVCKESSKSSRAVYCYRKAATPRTFTRTSLFETVALMAPAS